MRSALGKVVRKQFASEMSQAFPDFVELKGHSIWPGDRLYVHRSPHISFFLRLVPSHNADEFRMMYGWSSSGAPPSEQRPGRTPELEQDILNHDGYEFRVMQIWNEAGATEDRWWVLEDAMGVAFERTLMEFGKPGDTELETLERAMSEGLSYLTSIHRETAVEKLLPKIPGLMKDCFQCIRETVVPYFETVKKLKSNCP